LFACFCFIFIILLFFCFLSKKRRSVWTLLLSMLVW